MSRCLYGRGCDRGSGPEKRSPVCQVLGARVRRPVGGGVPVAFVPLLRSCRQLMSNLPADEHGGLQRPSPTILVVDDNAAKRIAVRAMLAPLGHRVVEVDSGREALRAVLRGRFAVILMDVRMPTLDGFETAKLIRQRPQSELTPIIFVTAFGGDEAETADGVCQRRGRFHLHADPSRMSCARKSSAFVGLFVQSEELQRSVASITDLNAALRASEVRARAVLQNVADAIVTAGEGGLIDSFNRSAQALFGYREDEVIGQPLQLVVAPSHHDEFSGVSARQVELARREGDSRGVHAKPWAAARTARASRWRWTSARCRSASEMFTIACIRDISGRKAYTEALEHRALHDELTGLPNRIAVHRPRGPGDRVRSSEPMSHAPCCSSTSTSLARSTRSSDARRATPCFRRSPGGCEERCATRTPSAHLGGDSFGILPVRADRCRRGGGDRVEDP